MSSPSQGAPVGPNGTPNAPIQCSMDPIMWGTGGNLGKRAFKRARSHGITLRLPRVLPRATRGLPTVAKPGKRAPSQKNCVSFESHISRIPLGDSNCRNGHFKEKCKGFPMIPSFLADSPPVSRSGALKLAQGPLFAHPFMLDCTKNHPQPPVDPKKGTYSIQHWHEHGNEHGHKSGCHTSAKAAAVAMFASPMGAG